MSELEHLLSLTPTDAVTVMLTNANSLRYPLHGLKASAPTDLGGQRTRVTLSGRAQSAKDDHYFYQGQSLLEYNRIAVQELFDGILDGWRPALPISTEDLLNEITARSGIRFYAEDFVQEEINNANAMNYHLRAKIESLRWIGEISFQLADIPNLNDLVDVSEPIVLAEGEQPKWVLMGQGRPFYDIRGYTQGRMSNLTQIVVGQRYQTIAVNLQNAIIYSLRERTERNGWTNDVPSLQPRNLYNAQVIYHDLFDNIEGYAPLPLRTEPTMLLILEVDPEYCETGDGQPKHLFFRYVPSDQIEPKINHVARLFTSGALSGWRVTDNPAPPIPTFRQPNQPQITGVKRNLLPSSEWYQPNNQMVLVERGLSDPFGGTDAVRVSSNRIDNNTYVSSINYAVNNPAGSYIGSLYIRAGSVDYAHVGLLANGTSSLLWPEVADTIVSFEGPGTFSYHGGVYGLLKIEGLSTTDWTRVEIGRTDVVDGTNLRLNVYPGFFTNTTIGTSVELFGNQVEAGTEATDYQAVRSATDYDGSGLPVGSIWRRTVNDVVVETLRYNGTSWTVLNSSEANKNISAIRSLTQGQIIATFPDIDLSNGAGTDIWTCFNGLSNSNLYQSVVQYNGPRRPQDNTSIYDDVTHVAEITINTDYNTAWRGNILIYYRVD